jgi:3-methylcrotonyl-CoA carboxylase alpha subunit
LRQEVPRVPTAGPLFDRLLIANRGEIAVRVIRACAELGIRSVAVYSEADRGALHVRLADESRPIGPGPAAESYLAIPRIVEAARLAEAQAVHPGYGFLAENPRFAEACAEAGLTFVGPSPGAMRLLGDKAAARRLAAAGGVPVVPGYDGPDQDERALTAAAARIGYPLLVKAAAGGGGRGMRAVAAPTELAEKLAAARRESRAAFGDDALILERLVVGARHVEVQLLGDSFGSAIHLGERDCSVQRRHQKVIEESPGPGVDAELRAALGAAAVRVARAAGYAGAGTCEFLLDGEGGFWFIEMNARLQVEHPVTELVTGLDLVRAQIEIAAGRPLRWRQADIRLRGHAVECRLYAEDPARDDLPAPGRLTRFEPPLGPGLRHDVGYAAGDVVPPFYDTMLAKLIAFGEDRPSAIERARAALDRYVVEGLPTNRELLAWILDHPTFRAGLATTEFLAASRPARVAEATAPDEALAAAVAWQHDRASESTAGPGAPRQAWRLGGQGIITFWAPGSDQTTPVVADRDGPHAWRIAIGERRLRATVGADHVMIRADSAESGTAFRCRVWEGQAGLTVVVDGREYRVRRAPPPNADAPLTRRSATGIAVLEAPLPGRVVRLMVGVGDEVVERQPVVVVEAMKIETTLAAPRDGVVAAIRCAVGDAVSGGQVLVELAPR